MHRSSENVAAIATALAKAQTELSNPEKAMIGTIYNARSESSQSFRYASLSSGLDIIRKVLGGQQIAVAQTTDIDRANGTVNLTTLLLHTSGEWISSDWPVCQLSETSAPRRMGAALTYARRYALFTMVGIAGEDDLDSPDIANNEPQRDRVFEVSPNSNPEPALAHSSQRRTVNPAAPAVPEKSGAEESATIRVQLIHEIQTLPQGELQSRAIAILKAKNRLSAEDAKLVEEAFAARIIVQGASSMLWRRTNLRPRQSIRVRCNRPSHRRSPSNAQGGAPESSMPRPSKLLRRRYRRRQASTTIPRHLQRIFQLTPRLPKSKKASLRSASRADIAIRLTSGSWLRNPALSAEEAPPTHTTFGSLSSAQWDAR
jgi:hypothetical protein